MDVPLTNLDIERALKTTKGYRGVFSYDLLPKVNHGEFAIVNTDNYRCSTSEKMDTIGWQFAVNMITLLCLIVLVVLFLKWRSVTASRNFSNTF